MEADLRQLNHLKAQIEKVRVNYKKASKERRTANYVHARLEMLEKEYSMFVNKHLLLISNYDSKVLDATDFMKSDVHQVVTEMYLDFKVELQDALQQVPKQVESDCGSRGSDVLKLPKIQLPLFSGKYTEWSSFRDLFKSMVHSSASLDDVQKLHYLKTQLTGEAEQIVKHIPITSKNYVVCWDLLNKRFNNKKFISNCILRRFFNQRNITSESSQAIKELIDTTSDCLNELSNLDIDVSSWDLIIIYIVSSKLDAETRKQWELKVCQTSDSLPTFAEFKQFLETRFRALEVIEPVRPKPKSNVTTQHKVMHVVNTNSGKVNVSCPLCNESHKIMNCKVFTKADIDERRSTVQNLGLCFNCLGKSHCVKLCRVSTKCRICGRKHHSLLHPAASEAKEVTAVSHPEDPTENSERVAAHFMAGTSDRVLLATALVKAECTGGQSTQVFRALLDQGSQASFITEAAVQLLRLKKIVAASLITGVGGDHGGTTSKYVVLVNIQSLHDPTFVIQVTAHVLRTLTTVLPGRKLDLGGWSDLQHVALADPNFYTPNKIDILLGAEVYGIILKEGLIKSPQGAAIAQDTYLGWIVSGQLQPFSMPCHNLISMHAQVQDDDSLKMFWELEAEPLNMAKMLTPEEQACEDYFSATTRRDETGRYIVKLPFRCEDPPCKYGGSKKISIKRFNYLERKLSKDVNLKKQYGEVINEYLLLGHMKQIVDEAEKLKPDAVYLPHHAVIREDKTTTKLRVVFDASCRGSNGFSLNDTLMVGPTLQRDLRHIVMRWRQHFVCVGADIIKMYRQVKIAEEDQDFQRIVWRDDDSKEIAEYKLSRVTFGTSCAPYLAVKVLQQIAHDEGQEFPLAAEKVLNDFYIDDLMVSCHSVTEAVQLYYELSALLQKGGFELQKWTCNKMEVLEKIKENDGRDIEIKCDKVTKVLGLTWDRSSDVFRYSVKLTPPAAPETKRKVISEIARLYDPLGWIAPCIITAKVFIQRLWLAGLGWDEELTPEFMREWEVYRNELANLVDFQIPRWIHQTRDDRTVELHGFCDASNIAYAAVIYMRVIDAAGDVQSSLVTAKTKVAPVKQISIPRLELCGALLVAKLLSEVSTVLNVPKTKLYAWSDSMVVLSWLSAHPSKWKTFIANRTSEILTLLDSKQWHHVQSKDNPADCASRGLCPTALLGNQLWKVGPPWLCNDEIEYVKAPVMETNLEAKTIKVHAISLIDEDTVHNIEERFSSLRRLIRVVAFCRRFLFLIRPLEHVKTTYLKASEIRYALHTCIRRCQMRWFNEEFDMLLKKGHVNKKNHLASLNPFIDDQGMLRVGGRLQNANLGEDTKHPFIIPHDSQLAKLIVADAHERALHGGMQLTLNVIRGKYWIIRAKTLVKVHIHNCIRCIRYAGSTKTQLMGQLPQCRVTPSKPFLNTGVDYAGPINIRVSKGRGNKSYKGYICLFVCMATRAVHIEAVSDLTSQSFLAAFKRFVARRGLCSDIWSDNGTNFVGASKEIKKLFSAEQGSISQEIASMLANNGTEWHFIPPHAPNFGGLWEAGIKGIKHHLKRVIGDSTLTYEEMATVLIQIEACLNSRPLCQSDDPNDPDPLTAGHFLVGQQLVLAPDYNYEDQSLGNLRRWQLTQRMVQGFWRRWSREYLIQFFHRYKWNIKTVEPKLGDIVLVKEDNLPPAKWLYGKIVDVHPGNDGSVRVATLRCRGSNIRRPTSKLCILPVSD